MNASPLNGFRLMNRVSLSNRLRLMNCLRLETEVRNPARKASAEKIKMHNSARL